MDYVGSIALRQQPKQKRGRRKVDHILRVAEAMFAESGMENVTTNALAARAGISIGSLYQFFPNKEAIVVALVERYLDLGHDVIQSVFQDEQDSDTERFVDRMFEQSVKLLERRPSYLWELKQYRSLSPTMTEKYDGFLSQYAKLYGEWLVHRGVEAVDKLLKSLVLVIMLTSSGLVPAVVRTAPGRERKVVMAESKSMIVNYIEAARNRSKVA